MDEKALFLRFWDKEAPATRKVLSRIPQEKSDYKPDAKSRTAREIAWLLVHEEVFLAEGLERGQFEWVELPTPPTMAEIVAVYDARHEELTERMKKLPATHWEKRMPFTFQGQEVMNETGYENWLDHAVRPGPPPRAALHVSPADGIDRAADLRTERRRADVARRSARGPVAFASWRLPAAAAGLGDTPEQRHQTAHERRGEEHVQPGALGREPPADGGAAQQDDSDPEVARARQDGDQRPEAVTFRQGLTLDARQPGAGTVEHQASADSVTRDRVPARIRLRLSSGGEER